MKALYTVDQFHHSQSSLEYMHKIRHRSLLIIVFGEKNYTFSLIVHQHGIILLASCKYIEHNYRTNMVYE